MQNIWRIQTTSGLGLPLRIIGWWLFWALTQQPETFPVQLLWLQIYYMLALGLLLVSVSWNAPVACDLYKFTFFLHVFLCKVVNFTGIVSLFVTYYDCNCAYFLWQVHSCWICKNCITNLCSTRIKYGVLLLCFGNGVIIKG